MREVTRSFVWPWVQAYAMARAFSVLEGCRFRVFGYRTGLPDRPWGYTAEPIPRVRPMVGLSMHGKELL